MKRGVDFLVPQQVRSARVFARVFVLAGAATICAVGCGDSQPLPPQNKPILPPVLPTAAGATAASSAAGAGATPIVPPTGIPATSAGSAAPVGTAGAASPAPVGTGAGSALPCEVSGIVKQHCSLCHDKVTQYTAPMPLVSWDDFMAPSKSAPATPVYKLVMDRVKDTTRPMPPQPMAALTQPEIAKLESWVAAGMPKAEAATACAGTPAPGNAGVAGSGAAAGGAGAEALGEDVECYKFLANGGSGAKYAVPATPDLYQCFYFDAPWGNDKVEGVSANFVIDNTAAVHHFILYTSSTGVPNTNSPCPTGAHPDGQFVVGWAPGATPVRMPSDVGLVLPGPRYLLETHYNAPSGGMTDASGIELCVTKKLRQQKAAVHPLGHEGFVTSGPSDVTGTCKPKGPFPIHIMTSNPHMHLKGTNMKTIIHRANGTDEMLIDKPFDFMNQLEYKTETLINEGDTLETTCTYNAPATFGTGTNEEMCYNFVTAYPAGSLSGGTGYTGLSANGNICIKGPFGF